MTQPLQPPPGMAAAAPLLTLEAPAPTQPVAATAAPKMAPAVDPAVAPQLDQKVEAFLTGLNGAATKSPEFEARAADIQHMFGQRVLLQIGRIGQFRFHAAHRKTVHIKACSLDRGDLAADKAVRRAGICVDQVTDSHCAIVQSMSETSGNAVSKYLLGCFTLIEAASWADLQ